MPERKSQTPLDVFRSTLTIIKDQSFKSPKHEAEVKEDHVRATVELFEAGAAQQVMQLRFMVNTGARMDSRQNFIVDKLPVMNSIAGWINEPGGNLLSVKRELIGRTYKAIGDDKVVVAEYFLPQGNQDYVLFQVARRHNGSTGIEGVVRKTVSREEAATLLFTGYEEHEEAQETSVFERGAARKELVAA